MKLTDFSLNSLNGEAFNIEQLKGKKVLLVNVASECGLTPQYTELEYLQEKYASENFTVIGVPCNDFGGQEPGSSQEIATFCSKNYGVTFPMLEKMVALGENKSPLYSWLTKETNTEVTWNFQKFLINENGEVEKSIAPQTVPTDEEIISWIEKK